MNPNLLCVIPNPNKGKRPLLLDNVPVSSDPEAGPFLITSSRSLLWVERAFESGFLRVAVRQVGAHDLYGDLVKEIARQGEEREWGNVVEPTAAGVSAGLAHLDYYGLQSPSLLYGEDFDIGLAPEMERTRLRQHRIEGRERALQTNAPSRLAKSSQHGASWTQLQACRRTTFSSPDRS